MLSDVTRTLLIQCITLLSVLLSASLHAKPLNQSIHTKLSDDTILVQFQPGLKATQKELIHTQAKGKVTKQIGPLRVDVVRVSKGSVDKALALYTNNPNVVFAEPNRTRPLFVPTTTEGSEPGLGVENNFDQQYGLHNTGQYFGATTDALGNLIVPAYKATAGADINWSPIITTKDVAVAVLDSGVECTHKDLTNKCIEQVNYVAEHNSGPNDELGHGTHVAGIIAAITDNGIGIAGVAPEAKIGAMKVCWEDMTYALFGYVLGQCDDDDVAQALVDVADSGLYQVVNLSLAGTEAGTTLQNAIDYAWGKGLVIVGAAGNSYSEQLHYPAGYDVVLSVGATDYHDNLAAYSTFGSWVSVLAPGTAILSTVPGAACGQPDGEASDCYDYKSGTSMAAPHVAGLAAVLAADSAANYSNSEIRSIIENSANKLGTLGQQFQSWVTYGRVDMAAATNYVSEPSYTHTASAMFADTLSAGKGNKKAQVTVTVSDDSGNPVQGVSVSGLFSGDFTEEVTANTDSSGIAVLTTEGTQKGGVNYEFCIRLISDSTDTTWDEATPCVIFP